MIRWLMGLFGYVTTCEDCGHQMPEGGKVQADMLPWNGTESDYHEWEECKNCGGVHLHYDHHNPYRSTV